MMNALPQLMLHSAGEDNPRVYRGLLGLPDAEILSLEQKGII